VLSWLTMVCILISPSTSFLLFLQYFRGHLRYLPS
jgi:hypothetical protein